MKKRFTEEQIIAVLREAETDAKVAQLLRTHGISRSTFRYRSTRAEINAHLTERLAALGAEQHRYGYRRLHVLIRRGAHVMNWRRLYRVYCESRVTVRRRKRKRIGPVERRPLRKPTSPNVS